jgi:hypothetical protein
MIATGKEMEPAEHLSMQLRFIERSCAAIDAGHPDEALRVAISIRVILHQTSASTSILTHLNTPSVSLLSETNDMQIGGSTAPSGSWTTQYAFGIGILRSGPKGRSYMPSLGEGWRQAMMPAMEWWNQIIYVIAPHRISRRDVVLGAANKDGGAHVGGQLSPTYAALVGTLAGLRGSELPSDARVTIVVALRQMGYELLNSPALLALAKVTAR